ncbi:MAG: RlpA-like double-psi beta-barrel domain-containing protein [Patescibacteria group bacterium]|nr:RlpA-like double-psi beta-barrel domain-containing protein [Patescibacteria group bacterium]
MKKIVILSILVFCFCATQSFAKDISLDIRVLKIDSATLKKGYTLDNFNGKFKVGIFPEVLSETTDVVVKNFYQPEKILPIPSDKKIISHIFEFDISNKTAFKNKKPLIIEIKYDSDYVGFKSIYYWDGNKKIWVKLPSYNMTGRKKMRANLHLPYARLAVMEDRGAMETGIASWYKWKNCDCAASPDYPKGTRLKVTNLDNQKSVVITVNDYGPERDKFPNRVIDLDAVAFSKIANTRNGVCNVRVVLAKEKETVVELTDNSGKVLGESAISQTDDKQIPDFDIKAKSAIVVNGKTGKILYGKNSGQQMPIASITKLMSAKVVLDLEPDWGKVMEYSSVDDDVFDYAGKWEMAYLYVDKGDTMTVKDLFFSSLVGSANNAVFALSRSTGLLRRDFVETMNRKAKEIGMENTHFTEPSGLSPSNISTAQDLAKLGRKVFNSLKILEASTAKQYLFSTINTEKSHTIKNRNKLLDSDLYILGTKTGYLDEAGHCLIVKAKDKNENEIIVVTLGNFEPGGAYFEETEKLVKWGFERI